MTTTTRLPNHSLVFLFTTALFTAACGGGGGGGFYGGGAKDGGDCDASPASCGGCSYDYDCRAPTPRCDTTTSKCAACLPEKDNCPLGQHCTDVNGAWTCTATCKVAADCNKGGGSKDCCNGLCVDTTADAKNCGACGKACPAVANGTASCTAGACGIAACADGFADCDKKTETGCEVQTTTDPKNCGACGTSCNVANATAACTKGACAIQSCSNGYADCDGKSANGCEAQTSADVNNCGGCGRACGAVPNGTSECRNGACGVGACSNGYSNCDGIVGNGCEVATNSDLRNCGGCALVCSLANATPVCQGGSCSIMSCTNGWADCDFNAQDGCESNIATDPANCGGCGNSCPAYPNASAVCNNKACALGACDTGFGNCNGVANDGCEASLNTDTKNCGVCGKACAINQACQNGACVQISTKVLVIGSPATSTWINDVQSKLQATGAFLQVDVFNANTSTPTLLQLQAYGAVLVFSDSSFLNATTLGDNLANYYDGGGQVVIATFANITSYTVGGRFGTLANGYMLMTPATQESAADSLGQIVEPQSPLMTGVTKLNATAAFKSTGTVANGGVVVARWAGGKPLVVRGVVKGRNRADLNFYPPSSTARADFWTGDGAILMKNALLYR